MKNDTTNRNPRVTFLVGLAVGSVLWPIMYLIGRGLGSILGVGS